MLRAALVEWAGLGLGWLGLALLPAWAAPLAVIWLATRLHALGVVLHELCHMPPQRGPQAWLVEALAGWPTASTVAAMRHHHLRHHRDSGLASDPYRLPPRGRVRRLGRLLATALLWPVWVLRAPVGLLALAWAPARRVYAALLMHRGPGDPWQDPGLRRCARAEAPQLAAHSAAAVAMALWPPLFWAVVPPALLASLLCGWRLLQEHTPSPAADRSMTEILGNTRDHSQSPLGKLLFAPRNIGLHIVHHLHPQVGEAGLPALRRWYQEALGERYPPTRGLDLGAG